MQRAKSVSSKMHLLYPESKSKSKSKSNNTKDKSDSNSDIQNTDRSRARSSSACIKRPPYFPIAQRCQP